MANRILLSESGLKISKPGVNVLTAGPADLLFTSDYGTMSRVYRGSFVVPSNNYGHTIPMTPTLQNLMPFVFMWAEDYAAGGMGSAGFANINLGNQKRWSLEFATNTDTGYQALYFWQGEWFEEGPAGVNTPPDVGPSNFPYVCHYIVVDAPL